MKNSMNSSVQQPMIVKYVESLHNGIQSQALSRYAIGYILRGTKYIYDGDKRQTLSRGDVFYLGIGHHYIENFPEGGPPFEQVLFYYTHGDLQRILMHLNITYGLNISNEHSCENCRNRSHVAMPAWNSLRNFFINTNNYLRDEDFRHDETAENIKMTELIYLLASHEDCCIKSKQGHLDRRALEAHQPFADIVQEGIPPSFPDAASQVVHPPAAHALASAAHLHVEIHLGNRQRMHLPQHLAFHQTLQEGVPDDARHVPPPPYFVADIRAAAGVAGGSGGRGNARGALIKNL